MKAKTSRLLIPGDLLIPAKGSELDPAEKRTFVSLDGDIIYYHISVVTEALNCTYLALHPRTKARLRASRTLPMDTLWRGWYSLRPLAVGDAAKVTGPDIVGWAARIGLVGIVTAGPECGSYRIKTPSCRTEGSWYHPSSLRRIAPAEVPPAEPEPLTAEDAQWLVAGDELYGHYSGETATFAGKIEEGMVYVNGANARTWCMSGTRIPPATAAAIAQRKTEADALVYHPGQLVEVLDHRGEWVRGVYVDQGKEWPGAHRTRISTTKLLSCGPHCIRPVAPVTGAVVSDGSRYGLYYYDAPPADPRAKVMVLGTMEPGQAQFYARVSYDPARHYVIALPPDTDLRQRGILTEATDRACAITEQPKTAAERLRKLAGLALGGESRQEYAGRLRDAILAMCDTPRWPSEPMEYKYEQGYNAGIDAVLNRGADALGGR